MANRPLEPKFPYIFVDGIWLKRSWGGEVQNVSVLVAIGVSTRGFREILGVGEGSREDAEKLERISLVFPRAWP